MRALAWFSIRVMVSAMNSITRRECEKHGICPLCGRECTLTFHHLIPRKLHRRTFYKKNFSKAELSRGIEICRKCHSGIHDLYDEMTLAREYDSFERIQSDAALSRHFGWVAKQKVKNRPQ